MSMTDQTFPGGPGGINNDQATIMLNNFWPKVLQDINNLKSVRVEFQLFTVIQCTTVVADAKLQS